MVVTAHYASPCSPDTSSVETSHQASKWCDTAEGDNVEKPGNTKSCSRTNPNLLAVLGGSTVCSSLNCGVASSGQTFSTFTVSKQLIFAVDRMRSLEITEDDIATLR